MIWKENRRHEFTAKSAYQVALHLKQNGGVEHSKAQEDSKWWKLIWALKVRPKINTFLWRAYSNVLPTRDNLHQKMIQVDPVCKLCCQKLETCAHLLWECPFAWNEWAMVKGRVQKCSNEIQDFFNLFGMLVEKLTRKELEQWATISWAVWNARNKVYFEKIQPQPKVIVEGALAALDTYQWVSISQEYL